MNLQDNLQYLMKDPRPDLLGGHLWEKLFENSLEVIGRSNEELALKLLKRFWTIRNEGTLIRFTHNAIKFEPLLEPIGYWTDMEFYLEMHAKYLLPHKTEIVELLELLRE